MRTREVVLLSAALPAHAAHPIRMLGLAHLIYRYPLRLEISVDNFMLVLYIVYIKFLIGGSSCVCLISCFYVHSFHSVLFFHLDYSM
jgi:hypothetical protein